MRRHGNRLGDLGYVLVVTHDGISRRYTVTKGDTIVAHDVPWQEARETALRHAANPPPPAPREHKRRDAQHRKTELTKEDER